MLKEDGDEAKNILSFVKWEKDFDVSEQKGSKNFR